MAKDYDDIFDDSDSGYEDNFILDKQVQKEFDKETSLLKESSPYDIMSMDERTDLLEAISDRMDQRFSEAKSVLSILGESKDSLENINKDAIISLFTNMLLRSGMNKKSASFRKNMELAKKIMTDLRGRGEEGRKVIEEILGVIMAMGFDEDPGKIAIVTETLSDLTRVDVKEIPRAIAKADSRSNFGFSLDTRQADEFLKNISSKSFLDQKDLEDVKGVIYNRVALLQVATAVNDLLESQLQYLEEEFGQKYGLAVGYNSFLLDTKTRLETVLTTISSMKIRQISAFEDLLRQNKMYGRAMEEELILGLLNKAEVLLDQTSVELNSLQITIELMMSDFNRFVKGNKLVSFDLEFDKIHKINDLINVTAKITNNIDTFFNEAYRIIGVIKSIPHTRKLSSNIYDENTFVTTSGLSGDFGGGFLFDHIWVNVSAIRDGAAFLLQSVETVNSLLKSTTSETKVIMSLVKASLKGRKRAIARGKSYYEVRSKRVDKTSVDYVFYVSDSLTNDLRQLNCSDEMISEIRGTISDTIFSRSGLENDIGNLLLKKASNRMSSL